MRGHAYKGWVFAGSGTHVLCECRRDFPFTPSGQYGRSAEGDARAAHERHVAELPTEALLRIADALELLASTPAGR